MTKEYDVLRMKMDLIEDRLEQVRRDLVEVRQSNRILEVLFSVLLTILLAIVAATLF